MWHDRLRIYSVRFLQKGKLVHEGENIVLTEKLRYGGIFGSTTRRKRGASTNRILDCA